MLSYAITDPSTLSLGSLETYLEHISDKADMVLYRDKNNPNYSEEAKRFVKAAKHFNFQKILLHNEIALAVEINADGVHLSSERIKEIPYAKRKGLFVIISTHTLEEIEVAWKLGADMVTFSPIFDTPNKGRPVGLEKLKEVCSAVNIPVIALGGIVTQQQINACKGAGAEGFASIRYFKINN